MNSQVLITNLTQWQDTLLKLLKRLSLVRIRQALTVLLVSLLMIVTADIFWWLVSDRVVPAFNVDALADVKPTSPIASNDKPSVSVDQIKSWALFGKVEAVAPEQAPDLAAVDSENLEETALNLQLMGVITLNERGDGYAVLEYGQGSGVYRVGEVLPVDKRVTLAKVFFDRAIINNRGNHEVLYLFGVDADSAAKNASAAVNTVNKASRSQQNKKASATDENVDLERDVVRLEPELKQTLLENPISLTSAIRIAQRKDDDGKLVGYRLQPGKEKKQFAELGLEAGDVLKSFNGESVTEVKSLSSLMAMLRESSTAEFIIERNGKDRIIAVEL